jgi:hypothetical protein
MNSVTLYFVLKSDLNMQQAERHYVCFVMLSVMAPYLKNKASSN